MGSTSDGNVTLVLGGVRSGKSRYAQRLAECADSVTFIATAEHRNDDEMLRKIERHRSERPEHWTTIEESLELDQAIVAGIERSELVLIDCLTLFAGKLLEMHGEDKPAVAAKIDALCVALRSAQRPIVLVSNEVGSGVVPASEMGRSYRDLLGEINQRVAAVADQVVLMIAGIPITIKGQAVS